MAWADPRVLATAGGWVAGDERSEPPAHYGGWPISDPRVLATASGAVVVGLGQIKQVISQDGTSTYGYDAKCQPADQ